MGGHNEPLFPFLLGQKQASQLKARQNQPECAWTRLLLQLPLCWVTSSASVSPLPPAQPRLVPPRPRPFTVQSCPLWRWPGISSSVFTHLTKQVKVLHRRLLPSGSPKSMEGESCLGWGPPGAPRHIRLSPHLGPCTEIGGVLPVVKPRQIALSPPHGACAECCCC